MRTRTLLARCLLCLAPVLAAPGCGDGAGAADAGVDLRTDDAFVIVPRAENVPLFDESAVIDIRLTFTSADWTQFTFLHDHPPTNPDAPNVYVRCSIEVLGSRFTDAACRPKGNSAYWKDEPKPQFVVKFNEWDANGRFLRMRRLNLEASPFTKAPVRDRLGMWIMREAGLHAPRVNHARVSVNGQLMGLYMNIEEVDKEFLEWQFDKAGGDLYSQGWQLETNKTTSDGARLAALNALVDKEPLQGDHAKFFAALAATFDVDTGLRMAAAENVLPTGDNWSNGSSNYFYYDDPLTMKFVIMPWDLDTIINKYGPTDADIYNFTGLPELALMPNKLLQLMLQNPTWKKQYEDDLVALRDGAYARLADRTATVCAQVRPDFVNDPHKNAGVSVNDFDADCKDIAARVQARIAFIKTRLGR